MALKKALAFINASVQTTRSRAQWAIVGLLVTLILTFAWAFVREMRLIQAQPVTAWTNDVSADCAVALTGGANRIREGLDLLSRQAVKKLIISGVNPQTELHEIVPMWPYYGDLRIQDVIIDRRSRTTFGNAQQTLPLVEVLRCRDLVLITSRVHMYRALRTFQAEFPQGYPIFPRSVIAGSKRPGLSELTIETLKSMFYSVWAY